MFDRAQAGVRDRAIWARASKSRLFENKKSKGPLVHIHQSKYWDLNKAEMVSNYPRKGEQVHHKRLQTCYVFILIEVHDVVVMPRILHGLGVQICVIKTYDEAL